MACYGAFTHTHTALWWDVLRFDAMLFFHIHDITWIFIYTKMAEDKDDDALTLSATYCEFMHINLYWSLIGCSLLVIVTRWYKNTISVFPAPSSTARLKCERLHWNTLSYQRSPSHPIPVQRCVCVCECTTRFRNQWYWTKLNHISIVVITAPITVLRLSEFNSESK